MQKGFTLIELMIVVAIIGILSAVAIPAYREYVTASYGASAMNALAKQTINLQMCILDTGVCNIINNAVTQIPELTSNPVTIVANTAAVLTYDNGVCKATVTIDNNGALGYSADTSDTTKASTQQCRKGAGLS